MWQFGRERFERLTRRSESENQTLLARWSAKVSERLPSEIQVFEALSILFSHLYGHFSSFSSILLEDRKISIFRMQEAAIQDPAVPCHRQQGHTPKQSQKRNTFGFKKCLVWFIRNHRCPSGISPCPALDKPAGTGDNWGAPSINFLRYADRLDSIPNSKTLARMH